MSWKCVTLLALAAGCTGKGSDDHGDCDAYLACAEATGTPTATLEETYGTDGQCWSQSADEQDLCRAQCTDALAVLAETNGDVDECSGGGGEGEGEGEVDAVCEEPTAVVCEDDLVLDLSYHEEVSDGEVTTEVDGDDFYTFVDATAGGYSHSDENPWVYVKFTADGAMKVEISDEESLESMDWDLAARRFILRLNGGDSGPSCVGAATLLESDYADVDSVPDGITYALDDFYTDDCTFVNDSSGLEGSPQVALSAWWEYPGCVATTGYPFLIQLADGHVIKLVVETYYETNQEDCAETGTPPSDGGYIRFRWRYLL